MTNFCNLEEEFSSLERSAVAIVPVPYDETSTWIRGSDRGPAAMIEASANLEMYDIETDSEVYRRGIHTDRAVVEKRSPEAMVEAVRRRVEDHIGKGRFAVVLGGEHTVCVGAVKA
ncbi:MAG: arginase family protein, partial [Pseudomonadota bacterium]